MDHASITSNLHANSPQLLEHRDLHTRKPPSRTIKARIRSISAILEKDNAAMKLYRENLDLLRAPPNCMQTPLSFSEACGQINNVFGGQLDVLKSKLAEERILLDAERQKINESVYSLKTETSTIQSHLKSIATKLGTFEVCIGHD